MKLSSNQIKKKAEKFEHFMRRYAVAAFLVFLLGIYGFLGLRIITLNQAQPDENVVAAKLKTAGVPRIDQDALNKIRQLQDNSVEVQTLFDKARSSPFQE